MKSRRSSYRGTGLALALALASLILVTPTLVLAQNDNETGLPLYPKTNTGRQYPANPEGYSIYTAQSPDSLNVVEQWYRHALPNAKETQDNNKLTHGIVLTVGKDKVLVYQLLSSSGTVLELQKYVH